MKLNNASISILISEKSTTIEIYDEDASILFAEIELSAEQLCQALSRLAHTKCSAEVHGLDRIGKKMIHKTLEFECGELYHHYRKDEQKLIALCKAACPKGWTPDNYFGSQGSFFTKDEKRFARCTIRQWI
jgi:hypothetical protein